MASKKTNSTLSSSKPLIFIDTNILLDFYRFRKADFGLAYLNMIDEVKDDLILTYQVEMEYKKNRQSVIAESMKSVNEITKANVNTPVIISQTKPTEMIANLHKSIKAQCKKIDNKLISILDNPSLNDEVYKNLQKIFKHPSVYMLHWDHESREEITNRAKERFFLGYPPRKKNDTSFGDSINWEWIIKCADVSGRNIIIVTRDSDYGISLDRKMILNDWLKQEFKERISQKKKITITNSLAEALKLVKVNVSKEIEKEEQDVITEHLSHSSIVDCND